MINFVNSHSKKNKANSPTFAESKCTLQVLYSIFSLMFYIGIDFYFSALSLTRPSSILALMRLFSDDKNKFNNTLGLNDF